MCSYFDTTDTGTLAGRYALSFLTESTTNEPERRWIYKLEPARPTRCGAAA